MAESDAPSPQPEPVQDPTIIENIDHNHSSPTIATSAKPSWQPSNLTVLYVTAALFAAFVIAEYIGSFAGNSLSLLGDAAAMTVDVFTYLTNMYAERMKAKHGVLDASMHFILEVLVSGFSVLALIGVTIYILVDAITIIVDNGQNSSGGDVNIAFLYAFAVTNFAIDVVSTLMFYLRGKDALRHSHMPIPIVNDDTAEDTLSISEERPRTLFSANLNMISALTHVGSDTLRTIAVFVAALIATFADVSGNICDAWAAIVVSITIFIAVIPLCNEIYKTATATAQTAITSTPSAPSPAPQSSIIVHETADLPNKV